MIRSLIVDYSNRLPSQHAKNNLKSLQSPKAERLRQIDALRGLAVSAVLLFHFCYLNNPHGMTPFKASWGHYGVELFFIISGFVIYMTLSRSPDVVQFAISRISRLYPAYWAGVKLTSLVAQFDTHPPGPLSVAANLSMMHFFVDARSIDNSYWTLSY